MHIDSFLQNASYVVDHFPEDDEYRVVMQTETHDLFFYIKNNKISIFEPYNKLDDSSPRFDEEDIRKTEKWFKQIMSE